MFTLSEEGKSGEYTASLVRIGEVLPIEGADAIGLVEAKGEDIIVRKDSVKPGDIMVYVRIETVLDQNYLRVNNLFELSCRRMNDNYEEVEKLIEEGNTDEAKKLVGFFNKHGRVRILKLRGVPSKGYLASIDSLVKWNPALKDVNFEEYLDIPCWDTINGVRFVKMYVPPLPYVRGFSGGKDRLANAKERLKRYDCLIPGSFDFHYSTKQLALTIDEIAPTDVVSCTVKLHGTSFILSNLLTRNLIQKSVGSVLISKVKKSMYYRALKEGKTNHSYSERRKNLLKAERIKKGELPRYSEVYRNIYSSRTVIKNSLINKKGSLTGYYSSDVWGEYGKLLEHKIPKGITIYGEIVGYETGSKNRMIQANYDYGCAVGTNQLMIYRVVYRAEDGTKVEYDVPQVRSWTIELMKKYPELQDRLRPIDILYHGTLADLYPEVPIDENWSESVLRCLKHDTEHFGMELQEPLNHIKMPREGIVIRVDGKPNYCSKLKSSAFLMKEAKRVDQGEVDRELSESLT